MTQYVQFYNIRFVFRPVINLYEYCVLIIIFFDLYIYIYLQKVVYDTNKNMDK